jgi:diacylglycerol kinase family enzyme
LNLINGSIDNKRLYNVKDEDLLGVYGIGQGTINILSKTLGISADKLEKAAEE